VHVSPVHAPPVKTPPAAAVQRVHEDYSRCNFFSGLRVRLQGLQARPELNGTCGILLQKNEAKGRWQVKLENEPEAMLIKEQNLEPAIVMEGSTAPFSWKNRSIVEKIKSNMPKRSAACTPASVPCYTRSRTSRKSEPKATTSSINVLDEEIDCPAGHKMDSIYMCVDMYECDVCERDLPPNSDLFYCSKCDHAICPECAADVVRKKEEEELPPYRYGADL